MKTLEDAMKTSIRKKLLTRVSHKKLTDKIRNSGLAYNTFLVTEKRVRSTLREHSQEEIAKLIDNGKNKLNHMKTQS